jgi:hypothetical protein
MRRTARQYRAKARKLQPFAAGSSPSMPDQA